MQVSPDIVFRNLERSEFIEKAVIQHIEQLEEFFPDIIRCRAVIECPHRHHHKGNLYHIQLDLTVPEQELVVKRTPSLHHAYEDFYVALRDAFDAMKRQLQEYVRRRRGETKHHEGRLTAKISNRANAA